ncbi:SpoIIE family protein phosphatase [Asanoa sp. WMMD1127]|uniref:PP2C family protein-serine/threonine phosphatase n=1 Tax=Asanoa sp. WMMD1127 TaxID=3016107 RepID=UPI0024171130|nr:SpoIIE family protein phosphatase [Asanoa sp. WMMD1127]MDG4824754.1 SpoIIE family protein phosphatase [Asanoa sp. WMMD1127]
MAPSGAGSTRVDQEEITSVVRELLAAVPPGCSWLLPVTNADGDVADFVVAAVSDDGADLHRRGSSRVGQPLSQLYPSMVDGPLWDLYRRVLSTGRPMDGVDFRYAERRAGVVADAAFEVSVYRVLGGLLVRWQRVDEARQRLERTELLGRLGWAEYDLATGRSDWSPGMFRIFERDPSAGPLSRAEQGAAMLAEDRGVAETAWQTLDSGTASDVTVRFRVGAAIKHLRILSDVVRDGEGTPLKINAVVQDVTARENTRSAIELLTDQLRRRETTAVAEHRLAAQLQNLIQPVPRQPLRIGNLRAMVTYLPAESAMNVGGDWYHAAALADGPVVLAVGDVAGHGLQAANGMAHLRFSLIAWLSIGIHDPGRLLGHLNRLCAQLKITATALVAVYDPAGSTLTWSRAGHMPPMLGRAGTAHDLGGPAQLLLGAEDTTLYSSASVPLRADDLVLLYTDGLVERRDGGTAGRVEELRQALSDVSGRAEATRLDGLREVLQVASPDDDTCALTVEILPPDVTG